MHERTVSLACDWPDSESLHVKVAIYETESEIKGSHVGEEVFGEACRSWLLHGGIDDSSVCK